MCPIGSGIGNLVIGADREGLDNGASLEEVDLAVGLEGRQPQSSTSFSVFLVCY